MNIPNELTHRRASPALRAEASAWIAKLHGPERSVRLEEDFRCWLTADAEHARAFEQVTEVWDAIGSVNVGGLPRLAAREEADRPRWRLGYAAAACMLLLAAAAGWMFFGGQRYSTDIGEQRMVTLEDGSRLYLNSGTRLSVDLTHSIRRFELESGEAFFEVARDEQRPFVVAAGESTVTALGTSFVVRHESERTAVTLVEGRVEVKSLDLATASAGRILKPGERVTLEKGIPAKVDVPRPDATAAWRRGEVVLDDTPLRAAIVEMNRYQRQRLVLEDAGIGTLPISGIYRTGNNEDFAHAVATVYGLQAVREGQEIHLRRPR